MSHVLAVFGVWALWNLFVMILITPTWVPYTFAMALGVGAQSLINPSWWWQGVGITGAAWFLLLVGDWLLVATDRSLANVGRRR